MSPTDGSCCAAGVVKMRRGLTAKYMAQLVSMREIYEAFDTWAAEIDTKSQRVSSAFPHFPRMSVFAGLQDRSAPGKAVHGTDVASFICYVYTTGSCCLDLIRLLMSHALPSVLGLLWLGPHPTACHAAGAAQQQAAGQGDGTADTAAHGGDPAAVQRGHCKVPPAPPLRYFMCLPIRHSCPQDPRITKESLNRLRQQYWSTSCHLAVLRPSGLGGGEAVQLSTASHSNCWTSCS
jgi:hypothetical protein